MSSPRAGTTSPPGPTPPIARSSANASGRSSTPGGPVRLSGGKPTSSNGSPASPAGTSAVRSGWHGRPETVRERTARDSLDRIEYAIDRTADLSGGVPALVRAGSAVTDPEPVDLTAVAECSGAAVADRPVDVRVAEVLPTVSGGVTRVARLFEILYANAADHGLPDPVDGSLTVRVEPTGTGFRVADDGTGIPEDEREAAFDWSVSTADDRVGVGLAVADAIAEAHGWSATVSEGSEGGARFRFAFDRARRLVNDEPPAQ